MKYAVGLAKDALLLWRRERAEYLAAAVSYYTLFAIAPFLLLSITIVSLLYGRDAIVGMLLRWGSDLGEETLGVVSMMVNNYSIYADQLSLPIPGLFMSLIFVVFGFNTLSYGLHRLWQVESTGQNSYLWKTLRSIAFMCILQLVLIAILAFEGILSLLYELHWPLLSQLTFVVHFFCAVLLLTLGFRILPNATLPYKSLLLGSGVASLLFLLVGKTIMWLYVTLVPLKDLYDAAGLIIVLMLWVFVTTGCIYYGAAFAFVHHRLQTNRPQNNVLR